MILTLLKAVVPVAGLGTRFLPATKAMPKEMLPIIDKPVIQFVVEEAVAAGFSELLFVTGREKYAIENHFDRRVDLEAELEKRGDLEKLAMMDISDDRARIHYVRQGVPLGLGHAVNQAQSFTGDEAFAVLLGDDLIDESSNLLSEMAEVHERTGANVVALVEVDPSEIHKYGCAAIGKAESDSTFYLTDIVEKPASKDAPSFYGVIGRYILNPGIHGLLRSQEPGQGGEIQLTDALSKAAKDNLAGGVVGFIYRGKRFDTGDKLGFLMATVENAVKREGLGEEFKSWIRQNYQRLFS